MVGQFVRVLIDVALELIANVIADVSVWTFGLVADASTHFGVPMLYQRAQMCFKGKFINLHLVLIPFFLTPHNCQLCQTNVGNPRCNVFIVAQQS